MQAKLTRFALVTFVIAASTSTAFPQAGQVRFLVDDAQVMDVNPFQQQMAQQAKQQERQYQQYMSITLDNIDRLCKLDEDQKKKLAIASKGAIDRTMDKWKKQMAQMQGQVQWGGGMMGAQEILLEGPALPEAAEEAKAEDPAAEIAIPQPAIPEPVQIEVQIAQEDIGIAIAQDVQMVGPAVVWNGPFGGVAMDVNQISTVANESLWTKTVAKVLTDEQKAAFKAAEEKRRLFRRQSAVDAVVSKIDAELILSEEQRTQITELVNKAVGHQFSVQENGLTADYSHSNGMTAIQRLPKAQMTKLLSKTQMARWNEFRRQYGAPEEVMPANPLLNWGNILGGFGLQ